MGEHAKHSASRSELRERIVQTAVESFSTHGIKSITMDDIAASLGISKRTLYEIFSDKESLLEECILNEQQNTDALIKNILDTSSNVLEVILRCYQWTIEKFHATNRKFFEDIKKYPKAYELVKRNHNRSSEDTVNFFKEGVKQDLFRSDVNFAIVNLLVRGQIDLLMNSNICDEYSFLEVYESIMFTFLRGISTEKGARELDNFICKYREKHTHSDETKK
ncbi:TetR/AcrR family transcriptional regulator [Bacteroides sp.]|uniref:TetR/AcrR family transcriptional regulator n=1 Tax=Bacteroides sp. TaxID=29523 RepID=UPI003AB78AD9